MSKKQIRLDESKKEQMLAATGLMKLMAHPLRLSILCLLISREEMGAGEIANALKDDAGQSQISQYLGKLREEGLVSTRREGQAIFYRIASPLIYDMMSVLYEHYCKS